MTDVVHIADSSDGGLRSVSALSQMSSSGSMIEKKLIMCYANPIEEGRGGGSSRKERSSAHHVQCQGRVGSARWMG